MDAGFRDEHVSWGDGVDAAGDEFRLLARNPIGEGTHSTPCVVGDRLYLRTFNHLVCIGAP